MFENIGGKLKILAKLFTGTSIIGSISAGIYLTVTERIQLWMGVALLIGVPLVCWILSALLYGFGELIEKTTEIAYNTRSGDSPVPQQAASVQTNVRQKRDVLEKWHTEGLITEDEYQQKLQEIDG